MAITYNFVDIRGVAVEPIAAAIIYENKTISEGYVTFEEDVKAETIFTEADATATMQAYTCNAPTANGNLSMFDAVVTPYKYTYYQEFCMDNFRFSRLKRDMKPGAWEMMSSEFERLLIGGVYAQRISADMENKFWSGATTATKAAVAAGANTTQEKALVAAMPTTLFDSLLTKVIYNSSNATSTPGVGGRVSVVGTTITATNIKTEYDKLYAAISPQLLETTGKTVYIYAPHSHRQLINIFNNNAAAYKDVFKVEGMKVTFYGIEVKFVPIPENVMLVAAKEHLFWVTDLLSDINKLEINRVQNNADNMFIKNVGTIGAHVQLQSSNVLYVG